MASAPPVTIPTIQYLRGIAALMVVALHVQAQQLRLGAEPLDLWVLGAGVDIFFVISGFIMWVTTATRPERTAREFMRDRLIRIVPLYWVVTATMLAILLVYPQAGQTAIVTGPHVAASFLFVPALNPASGEYTPLLIPGWSLNYEMVFYLIFALAMLVARGSLRTRAVLLIGSFMTLVLAGALFSPSGIAGFYTSNIVVNFVLGIALGIAYLQEIAPRTNRWWWLIAAAALLLIAIGIGMIDQGGRVLIAAAAAALVFGAVHLPAARPNPVLLSLGDWSYSLYLIHPIVLSAACQLWLLSRTTLPISLFTAGSVLLCIAAAAVSFRLIERPITAALKSRLGQRRQLPRRDGAGLGVDGSVLKTEEGREIPVRGS